MHTCSVAAVRTAHSRALRASRASRTPASPAHNMSQSRGSRCQQYTVLATLDRSASRVRVRLRAPENPPTRSPSEPLSAARPPPAAAAVSRGHQRVAAGRLTVSGFHRAFAALAALRARALRRGICDLRAPAVRGTASLQIATPRHRCRFGCSRCGLPPCTVILHPRTHRNATPSHRLCVALFRAACYVWTCAPKFIKHRKHSMERIYLAQPRACRMRLLFGYLRPSVPNPNPNLDLHPQGQSG